MASRWRFPLQSSGQSGGHGPVPVRQNQSTGPPAEMDQAKAQTGRQAPIILYLKRQIGPELADAVINFNSASPNSRNTAGFIRPAGMAHVVKLYRRGWSRRKDWSAGQGKMLAMASKPGSHHVIKDQRGHIIVSPPSGAARRPDACRCRLTANSVSGVPRAENRRRKLQGAGIVVLDPRTGEDALYAGKSAYPNNRQRLDPSMAPATDALTDCSSRAPTLKAVYRGAGAGFGHCSPGSGVQHRKLQPSVRRIKDSPQRLRWRCGEIIRNQQRRLVQVALLMQPWKPCGRCLTKWSTVRPPGSFLVRPAAACVRHKTWKPIEQATMSYGRGISLSLDAAGARLPSLPMTANSSR